ncbi:RNA polymerase sigma factor [Streptacidiphilus sp. EB103A]|uniref:RNA polymerase sigma factor n=1 Tax=Streptacidiphilus sp. EB103A TaxID=3156275 RepID=UPI0035139705
MTQDTGADTAAEPDVLGQLTDAQLLGLLAHDADPPPPARTQVYEELTQRHAQRLLNLAAYLLRDHDAAQDVSQQALLDAMHYLEKHRGIPRPEGFADWLMEFGRRRARKHASITYGMERPGSTEETVPQLSDQKAVVIPGDDPVRRAQAERTILEVVATLDPQRQELYRLRIQQGLTGAQIAKELGQEPKTVSNRCTELNTLVARRYHALLLARGDRTQCAVLRSMLETHESAHGAVFTAELADAVIEHYSTCKTCGNCATCRIETKKLVWDAAPVLIPILALAALREQSGRSVQSVAETSPVQRPLQQPPPDPPPPEPPAPRQRKPRRSRPGRRRLPGAAAAVGSVLVVAILIVAILNRTGSSTPIAPQPVAATMPAIAYAADGALRLRVGTAPARTLITVPSGQKVSKLLWSADRQRLGWISHSDTAFTDQLHLTDAATGATRTWPCPAGCNGAAFAGDRLFTITDAGTLTGYPFTGGAATTPAFVGLTAPADPTNTTMSAELLGSTSDDANLIVFATPATTPGQGPQLLYRVSPRGMASRVSADPLTAAPGGDRAPGGMTALAPDGTLFAYGGNILGGDMCESSDSVTVIDLTTGIHSAHPFPASDHRWRISGVWIAADHSLYASAAPQAQACPNGPAPTPTPATPPTVFRLDHATWTPTGSTAQAGGSTRSGWTALLSTTGTATTLAATFGKTRLDLGSGATAFAWTPPDTPAVPVLGTPWNLYQQGYGLPHPNQFFNGGDPTGAATQIHWTSWGGPTATGTAQSLHVTTTVAAASLEPADIEAFDRGLCDGVLMYRALRVWQPQHQETFNPDPKAGYDLCGGGTRG